MYRTPATGCAGAVVDQHERMRRCRHQRKDWCSLLLVSLCLVGVKCRRQSDNKPEALRLGNPNFVEVGQELGRNSLGVTSVTAKS